MGAVTGGTIRDLAQAEVLITFEFKPRETGKTIEQILSERNIKDEPLRTLCQKEADRMAKGSTLFEQGKLYIFYKDEQGNYFWRNVTGMDVLKYRLRRLLN